MLLGIERLDGTYLGVPHGDTVINAGDVLVLYSRSGVVAQLDARQRDGSGDAEHRAAMREQKRVERKETHRDTRDAR